MVFFERVDQRRDADSGAFEGVDIYLESEVFFYLGHDPQIYRNGRTRFGQVLLRNL